MKRGIESKRNRSSSFVEVASFCVVFISLLICACVGNSFAYSIVETHGWVNSHGIGSVLAGGNTADGGSFHYYDSVNANTLHYIDSQVNFTNGGYAEAYASTKLGENHVFAYATFPSFPYGGYASGDAKSVWVDQINPFPNAPVGTLQSLPWTIVVSGSHSMPNFEIGGAYANETVLRLSASDGYDFSFGKSYDTYDGSLGTGNLVYTGIWTVPAQHVLTYSVSIESLAYVGYNATVSSVAFADYSHSVYFYLGSAPDVNTIALSGHDYARPVAAVPEPSTLSLIVSCLGGLGAAVFTRGRKPLRKID